MKTLPRKKHADLPETMFLRPREPEDHKDFNMILPWMTPLLVYRMNGDDWVRWSIPKTVATEYGMDAGCACCGESMAVDGGNDDFHVDTAWKETDWWLTANEYAVPIGEKE